MSIKFAVTAAFAQLPLPTPATHTTPMLPAWLSPCSPLSPFPLLSPLPLFFLLPPLSPPKLLPPLPPQPQSSTASTAFGASTASTASTAYATSTAFAASAAHAVYDAYAASFCLCHLRRWEQVDSNDCWINSCKLRLIFHFQKQVFF